MSDRDRPTGTGPLVLPPAVAEPARAGFPWIASVAPVAAALAIWGVTGSAFALVFAALGPLVAVATMLDARRNAARARRRSLADRTHAIARLRVELTARHASERAAAWRRSPPAREAVERPVPRWRHATPPPIVLGRGPVPSEFRIEGVAVDDADAALVDEARRLDGAPVRVDLDDGIGFVGDPVLARAAARAALVQCTDAAGPAELAVQVPVRDWEWARVLPHRHGSPSTPTLVVHDGSCTAHVDGPGAAPVGPRGAFLIAVARDPDGLPPGIGSVLHLASPRSGVLHRMARQPLDIEPELLAAAEASAWAGRLEQAARRAGFSDPDRDLPRRVPLSSLPRPATDDPGDRARLPAVVGLAGDGPVELELTSGPHALVGGTTGSGKSEFLLAWITSLARAHPPHRVAFLLVDFKGGAAFAPVASLPHVTGIVTDLDGAQAARAVSSLRAEIRHRELVLRAAGARDLAMLPEGIELPRLVVVVDEFQAMVERFPELGDVIADLAARGRSLGVHLVLAAQRPNGVVREQVMANCGIRVSLRVLQRGDSLALVGTDGAALIEPGRPGLAIADAGDGRTVRFQSAIADEETIEAVAIRHADADPPRRPWLDPLPDRVTLDTIDAVLAHGRRVGPGTTSRPSTDDGGSILLGVVDEPDRQRRSPAAWRPEHDGALAVLGAPRSGRSGLLAAIAAQMEARHGEGSVLRVEGSRSAVWDALEALRAGDRGGGPPALVVLDDLDALFGSWPDDYRLAALLRIEELFRLARREGIAVAASAARLNGMGAGVRDGFTTTAFLRHASRADLVHAGGAGNHWGEHDPPGAGQWRGRRAQFLHADIRPADGGSRPQPVALDGCMLVAIASATPDADAAALRARLPRAEVIRLGSTAASASQALQALQPGGASGSGSTEQRLIVGDADDWAANWSLAHAARSRATIIVHGGQPEFRSLARASALPPLLDDPVTQCWMAVPGDAPTRRAWFVP